MKFNTEIPMNNLIQKFNSVDWSNIEIYKEYLAQSFYYTSYSTRMLAASAGASDRMNKALYDRMVKHIREEHGHDHIATVDLKALGGKVVDYPEMGITRALWEPQFFKISKSPATVLGYILALEKFAVETFKPFYQTVSKTYSEKASVFVKVHADEDPDHVEKAEAEIARCTPEEQALIYANYEQTCEVFGIWFETIAKKHSAVSAKAS